MTTCCSATWSRPRPRYDVRPRGAGDAPPARADACGVGRAAIAAVRRAFGCVGRQLVGRRARRYRLLLCVPRTPPVRLTLPSSALFPISDGRRGAGAQLGLAPMTCLCTTRGTYGACASTCCDSYAAAARDRDDDDEDDDDDDNSDADTDRTLLRPQLRLVHGRQRCKQIMLPTMHEIALRVRTPVSRESWCKRQHSYRPQWPACSWARTAVTPADPSCGHSAPPCRACQAYSGLGSRP